MKTKDHVREIIRQTIEDSWDSEESEERVSIIAANNIEELYKDEIDNTIKEIEKMSEQCQESADHFKESGMITSEISSLAMKSAYNQVIKKLKKII